MDETSMRQLAGGRVRLPIRRQPRPDLGGQGPQICNLEIPVGLIGRPIGKPAASPLVQIPVGQTAVRTHDLAQFLASLMGRFMGKDRRGGEINAISMTVRRCPIYAVHQRSTSTSGLVLRRLVFRVSSRPRSLVRARHHLSHSRS